MKCERLISLIKNWYVKVQEEAMAPARMVAFMEKHISQCEECLEDPDVRQEVEKIREIVLPPSKVPKPKVIRVTTGNADADEDEYEDEEDETSEDDDDDEDMDSDDGDEDEDDLDPDLLDDDDEI
ncbi:MAG: hypothetical protein ACWGOD_07415 [Desulfobulbales bacterium]